MAFSAFATGTAQEQAPRRRSRIALFLLLPGILYLMLFFLVPLVSLVLTSLQEPALLGDIGEYQAAFRWENYVEVVNTYGEHILRSFVYAILATIFALLFSYPLAYFIGVTARRWPLLQNLMLVLVIAPFFISFLLRTLAGSRSSPMNRPSSQASRRSPSWLRMRTSPEPPLPSCSDSPTTSSPS